MVKQKDVIKKTGIVFKPDKMPDPKPFHPAVVILPKGGNSGKVYYLTTTSQVLKFKSSATEKETQYYKLIRVLPAVSLVNLDYIYKADKVNDKRMAELDIQTYSDIIKQFKKRQEFLKTKDRGADEYYDEIRRMI